MAEKAVQTAIIEYLRGRGAYAVNIGGSASTPKGTADIIACYRGQFVALEVKKPVDSYGETKTQAIRARQVTRAGGFSYVVTSVPETAAVLKHIDEYLYQMLGV